MTKIYVTKDYSMFKKHENNRAIDRMNLKRIIFSIQSQNLLQFRPMVVDNQMRVIDGQHRLEAAKSLDVEIYYQITDQGNSEEIILLNANQKNWNVDDYVNYHCAHGNENYLKLKKFATERNMTIYESLKFLTGRDFKSQQKVKSGQYIFPDEERIAALDEKLKKLNEIIDLLKRYIISNRNIMKSNNLKHALMMIFNNPNLDYNIFIEKLTYKAESLRVCTNSGAYYALFRDIYNWRNSNPIE
jgi:hypothetical protein